MTEVYLIRHGQTVWNQGGKYQGHTDVPLSAVGRQQAQQLQKKLATTKIAAFYASDLARAYDTAKIIAEPHNLEVRLFPEFRELNFGCWEGLNYEEIMQAYGDQARQWYANPATVCIPGGESCLELKERSYKLLLQIIKRHDNEAIALITHGGTIRILIMAAMGWDFSCFWRISQDNTALNIIAFYEEQAVLKLLNDTCHLHCLT